MEILKKLCRSVSDWYKNTATRPMWLWQPRNFYCQCWPFSLSSELMPGVAFSLSGCGRDCVLFNIRLPN